MLENRATGYGPNIATDPATLSLTRNMTIHDDLQMEPGQDTFNFLVGLIDADGVDPHQARFGLARGPTLHEHSDGRA